MSKNGPWAFNVSICADTDEDIVYSNMPAAESFLFNSPRHITLADLSGMNSVRMLVNKQNIAGNTGSKLTLKYSETYSENPSDYTDIGLTPVSVDINVESTFLQSSWVQIIAPQNDVFLAIIGSGGDGIISPHFGHISVNFS